MPLRVQLVGTIELPPQELPTETAPSVVRVHRAAEPDRVDLAYLTLAEHLGVPDQFLAVPDQPGVGIEIDQTAHEVLDDVVLVGSLLRPVDGLGGGHEFGQRGNVRTSKRPPAQFDRRLRICRHGAHGMAR